MKALKTFGLVLIIALFSQCIVCTKMENTVNVGGAPMYPSRILSRTRQFKRSYHTGCACKKLRIGETLEGAGPFTVFAPTNEAFDMLPKGTVETLLKPENKAKLQGILPTICCSRLDTKALAALIKAGNGNAELKTVAGGKLWAMMKGNKIVLKDESGGLSTVTIKNVYQSNA